MVAADEDALIAPRRDELSHGIVELKASLLPQNDQPHAHDRLRHRVDAEDRIPRDPPLSLDLEVALRLEVRDLSAARHEREGAGELASVDVTLEVIGDASEPRRRQSDFFGLHEHFMLLLQDLCSCAGGRRGLSSGLLLAPATVRGTAESAPFRARPVLISPPLAPTPQQPLSPPRCPRRSADSASPRDAPRWRR